MYNYNLENRVERERDHSAIAIVHTYQIKINY